MYSAASRPDNANAPNTAANIQKPVLRPSISLYTICFMIVFRSQALVSNARIKPKVGTNLLRCVFCYSLRDFAFGIVQVAE